MSLQASLSCCAKKKKTHLRQQKSTRGNELPRQSSQLSMKEKMVLCWSHIKKSPDPS